MTGTLVHAPARRGAPRAVSRPHEPAEREAERAAETVMRGGSVADWSFASSPAIHRCGGGSGCTCDACSRRRAEEARQLPGQPLDTQSRRFMESRFGTDFGSVRMHTGDHAAATARALDASAFTTGEDIVSAGAAPTVATGPGRALLAHELAHVVQHRQAGDTTTIHRQAATAPAPASTPSGATPAAPASAPAAPTRPDRETRQNVGRGGHRVDAELDRRAVPGVGWLTVQMKVQFDFVNTPRPWPSPASQTAWRDSFIQTVARRWSFKHYLVPEAACPGEPPMVAVRVQVIPVTSSPHFTMHISNTENEPTSSVGGREATMDVHDVRRRSDIPQTPAEHEFGHMLGLPHIHCATNEPECYGTTREERADIMGEGSYVSTRDYQPFAELMANFTSCTWRVRQGTNPPTDNAPLIGGLIGGGLGLALGAGIGSLLGPIGAIVGGLIGAGLGALAGWGLGNRVVPG